MRKYYFIVLAPMCFMLAFLPVSLNAGGPPLVNANVINTPNVNIVNPEASPVPIKNMENPARSAFNGDCDGYIPVGSEVTDCSISIPEGKRAVIEFVSASCYGNPADTFPTVIINVPRLISPDQKRSFLMYLFGLEPKFANNPNSRGNFASKMVKFYADSIASPYMLEFSFNHTNLYYEAYCVGNVSGYLVDFP